MKPIIFVEQFRPHHFKASCFLNCKNRSFSATGESIDEAVEKLLQVIGSVRCRFNVVCKS